MIKFKFKIKIKVKFKSDKIGTTPQTMTFLQKQPRIWILCLALMLSLVQMRALASAPELLILEGQCATSANSQAKAEIPDCCKSEDTCCCKPAPIKPGKVEAAAASGQLVKFISLKGSGRLLPQLTAMALTAAGGSATTSGYRQAYLSFSNERPLYIVNRALLI